MKLSLAVVCGITICLFGTAGCSNQASDKMSPQTIKLMSGRQPTPEEVKEAQERQAKFMQPPAAPNVN